MFTKLLTVKAAAVALGVLAAGGVAAAATGTLPAPAQQVAHAVFGSATSTGSGASTTTAPPATTVTTTAAQAHGVGPDAAGPAAQGLCRAWAAGQGGQHGRKLDAVAFAALAKAAGGSGKVAAYCAKVTGAAAPASGAPASSAAPGTTRGSGRGGSPTSVPPSMVPSSTTPPTTHGGPPSSAPASTVPDTTRGH